MLLANGFGANEWEGIQLNGLPGGHTFMTSFYKKGVLANEEQDPVMQRYWAALLPRLGSEQAAAVLGMNRFNNIIYPNLLINAQYQQMRVTIPLAVDLTHIRIYCFLLRAPRTKSFSGRSNSIRRSDRLHR